MAVKPFFFLLWTKADRFTGEQTGKYGGVNGALGNGYKGESAGSTGSFMKRQLKQLISVSNMQVVIFREITFSMSVMKNNISRFVKDFR